MISASPAVPHFLKQLAGRVAAERAYLSTPEQEALIATVRQFAPGFGPAELQAAALAYDPRRLRKSLGQVAGAEGRDAEYAVVGTVQLALADGRFDDQDLELIHWVGDSLGFERARIGRLLARARN